MVTECSNRSLLIGGKLSLQNFDTLVERGDCLLGALQRHFLGGDGEGERGSTLNQAPARLF